MTESTEGVRAEYECDDDPPMICPVTGAECVRAFCDDYGCATKARVPLDEYDYAAGSTNWNELMPRLPTMSTLKKRRKSP